LLHSDVPAPRRLSTSALCSLGAAVAFYTLVFVWTVGLVLYEVLLSA
jgi:hypothetical protein